MNGEGWGGFFGFSCSFGGSGSGSGWAAGDASSFGVLLIDGSSDVKSAIVSIDGPGLDAEIASVGGPGSS